MIAIGSDHGGFELKEEVKRYLASQNIEYIDCGCDNKEACDYPIFGKKVSNLVADGTCQRGIVICTTGLGMAMVANKVRGVRAAVCSDSLSAKLTVLHNNANVLSLGAGIVGTNLAISIVKQFICTDFSGEERHQRRIDLME